MAQNYFLNGRAHGPVAEALENVDPGRFRPWVENGRAWCEVFDKLKSDGTAQTKVIPYHPVINAPATLPPNAWKWIDAAVQRVERLAANAIPFFESAGLTLTGVDGMAVSGIESSVMTDITDAVTSMDPEADSNEDQPELETAFMPLPFTIKNWSMSLRQRNTSRRAGFPFDTTLAELATEKVVLREEKLLVGSLTGISYGGGKVYGLTNHPSRMTKVLTAPTDPSWTPDTLLDEIQEMRESLRVAVFNGPYRLVFGPKWDLYLDKDYSATKGDLTVRQRILQTPNVTGGDTFNYLGDYDVLLFQASQRVARVVNGFPLTTLQWESKAGLRLNFKTISMRVPQIREDALGVVGIVHGSP